MGRCINKWMAEKRFKFGPSSWKDKGLEKLNLDDKAGQNGIPWFIMATLSGKLI